MTLSRPLEDLIAPDTARILAVLERTGQPLTGRTIAALTGTVSRSTVNRQLAELVRRGLVVKVPGGYEINRDHLAYQAVVVLLNARDELRRRVAEDVTGWETPPVSVVLFGSVARGQESLDSDIDILLVRPTSVPADDRRWSSNVADLSYRIGRWCGAACETLEYSPDELAELRRGDDPLVASLLRDGITLSGAELDTCFGTVTI